MVYKITFPAYSENKCILNTLITSACYSTTSARKNAALCLSLQEWVLWENMLSPQWMWNVCCFEGHIGVPSDHNI